MGITLDEAIRRNPYNPKKGNESAYCRYLRYNVDGWYQLDSKEVYRRWKVRKGMTFNNLCNSCTNIGCEFQSGIVRTKCAFYMPPHIEPDNCGNYVVMQSTTEEITIKATEHIDDFMFEVMSPYCNKISRQFITKKDLENALTQYFNKPESEEHQREFIELVVDYINPDLCTYPEYRGKPYFSIKYRENDETHIGFGTYKIEILSQWIKKYFISDNQPKPKWIPVSERLPEKNMACLVTVGKFNLTQIAIYSDLMGTIDHRIFYQGDYGENSFANITQYVKAWMSLPEPYKAESENKNGFRGICTDRRS